MNFVYAKETAQQLRALVFAEDLGVITQSPHDGLFQIPIRCALF